MAAVHLVLVEFENVVGIVGREIAGCQILQAPKPCKDAGFHSM